MDGTRQDTENARGRSPLPRAASTASFPRGSVRRLVVRLMTVSSRRPELPVASRGPAGSGTVSATRRHADPCRPDRRGTGLHAWWSPGFGPAPGSRDRLPGGHARRGHSLSSLSPSHNLRQASPLRWTLEVTGERCVCPSRRGRPRTPGSQACRLSFRGQAGLPGGPCAVSPPSWLCAQGPSGPAWPHPGRVSLEEPLTFCDLRSPHLENRHRDVYSTGHTK